MESSSAPMAVLPSDFPVAVPLANDGIEKSQGMGFSSASMAVLPGGFPASVPALAVDRCFLRMGPEGFRSSWGLPNPLHHPADGLEWSTTVDRWAG